MRIIRAQHLGMCFGVRDAITLALETAEKEPITILGDLVHNDSVLSILRSKGVRSEREIENVRTRSAMITAHGSSQRSMERARAKGLRIVEATCPLVHFAHRAMRQILREGFHPVIIGRRDHVEVRGMTDDLEDFDVILSEEDVQSMTDRERIGIVAQTTQPIDKVRSLVLCVQRRFPESEVRFIDTVCQPTKQRQTSAVELAHASDIVVVVGGANSNNTRQLVVTCQKYCGSVYHVQDAQGLKLEWFIGAETVGLTAGTSTPDSIIDEVEGRMRQIGSDLSSQRLDSPDAFNSMELRPAVKPTKRETDFALR